MSGATSAPAVLDALVDRFTTAFAGETDFPVIDGPTGQSAFALESLAVGTQDDEAGLVAVDATMLREGAALGRETFSVNCDLTVLGDANDTDTFAPVRARIFGLFGLLKVSLAPPNHTLDDLVMSATVGQWSLMQQRTARGPAARIQFAVDIDAYEH